MERERIAIRDLTDSAVTRYKGSQAGMRLEERIQDRESRSFVLDFSGLRLLSASFIDEIVLKTQEMKAGRKCDFVFEIDSDSQLNKLARSAGIRKANLQFKRPDQDEVSEVEPVYPRQTEVV
ncbi:MAG: hypothetical protein KC931_19165, partial [Candidatus Omnitrophica bacterium]|nr:hypothetical protein [Candidatus Omnitrophota bacterium]